MHTRRSFSCIITLIGLATCWPYIFCERLFPLTLTRDAAANEQTLLLLYIFYVFAFALSILILVLLNELRPGRIFSKRLVIGSDIACLIGIVPIALLDTASVGSIVLAAAGLCLFAITIPANLVFWSHQLITHGDRRGIIIDAIISFALFIIVMLIRSLVGGSGLGIAILFPILSGVCALLVQTADQDEKLPATKGPLIFRNLPYRIIISCLVYFILAKICDILLDCISLQALTEFRPLALIITMALIVIIGVVLLVRAQDTQRSEVRGFVTLSACFLAALFITSIMSTDQLPVGNYVVVIMKMTLGFFIWLYIMLAAKARHIEPAYALVAYLMLLVIVPNCVHSVAMYYAAASPLDVSANTIFIIVAAVTLLVAIVSIIVIFAFAVNNEKREPQITTVPSENSGSAYMKMQELFGLSDREIEVVRLAQEGKTVKHISQELSITEDTVYTHFKHIYRKTSVHSREELMDLVEQFE